MDVTSKIIRKYRFSDGVLLHLARQVVRAGTRDNAELDALGVTTARLNALQTMATTFVNTEDDVEWKGLVSIKRELKDAALEECKISMANIRRMAANAFGEKSSTYRRFGFNKINRLSDVLRIKAYFRIWRRASENAAAMASEGMTAQVLADYLTACETYDLAYDVMEDTAIERDIAAENRVQLGNSIYAEVAKISNTGKTYWFTRSEAKYNDYLITPSGTSAPEKPQEE